MESVEWERLCLELSEENKAIIYGFHPDEHRFLLVVNLRNTPSRLIQLEMQHRLVRHLEQRFAGRIGVSEIRHRRDELWRVCSNAKAAVEHSFCTGKTFYTIAGKTLMETGSAKTASPELDDMLERVKQAIRNLQLSSALEWLERLFASAERHTHTKSGFHKVTIPVLDELSRLQRDGKSKATFQPWLEELEKRTYLRDLKWWLPNLIRETLEDRGEMKSRLQPAVAEALKYLEEHFDQPLSLSEIAERVGLNPNYFSELFKEETGGNFSHYLTKLRLRKAEYLLRRTDLKTYVIAEQVGYPNLSYFSRKFKKYIGVSPQQYRIQDKGGWKGGRFAR